MERMDPMSVDEMVFRQAQLLSRIDSLELQLSEEQKRRLAAEQRAVAATAERDRYAEMLRVERSGLSRFNLCCPEWHRQHPKAANHLFGFNNFDEAVLYMEILFQIEGLKCPVFDERDTAIAITPFEKALVTKMRFQLAMCEDTLALIWGRSQSRINTYIQEWAPLWGRAGRDLSLLDIDEEYIELELPAVFRDQGLEKHGAQVDGKDFLIETPRTHTAITRACWSDKSDASAARCCTWNLGSGLSFEHTPLLWGVRPKTRLFGSGGGLFEKFPSVVSF